MSAAPPKCGYHKRPSHSRLEHSSLILLHRFKVTPHTYDVTKALSENTLQSKNLYSARSLDLSCHLSIFWWIPSRVRGCWRQPSHCWARVGYTISRSPVCRKTTQSNIHTNTFMSKGKFRVLTEIDRKILSSLWETARLIGTHPGWSTIDTQGKSYILLLPFQTIWGSFTNFFMFKRWTAFEWQWQ